jgi:hypothetical protein
MQSILTGNSPALFAIQETKYTLLPKWKAQYEAKGENGCTG